MPDFARRTELLDGLPVPLNEKELRYSVAQLIVRYLSCAYGHDICAVEPVKLLELRSLLEGAELDARDEVMLRKHQAALAGEGLAPVLSLVPEGARAGAGPRETTATTTGESQ